jgi:hypothetical protein
VEDSPDLASAKDVREDSHPDLIGTVSPGLSALVDSSTPAALAEKASSLRSGTFPSSKHGGEYKMEIFYPLWKLELI